MTLLDIARSTKATIADAVRGILGVRDSLAEIDRQIELKLQAIEELRALPIHPDDHVARMRETVDERAKQFERRFARIADAMAVHPADPVAERWRAASVNWVLLAPPASDNYPSSLLDEDVAQMFVHGDAIKAAFERAIRARDHSGHGPPAADRAKTIAKLDAELLKLRAEREEILDALAQLRREGEADL